MFQSVWLRRRGRRSLLPTRDLFDADLDRARSKPGCALCRLIQEHNQHSMHSFLWEYCTDPHIGMSISKSWGFCPFHTWSLVILEHERMGDGLGITIVYQALLRQLRRTLSSGHQPGRRSMSSLLPIGPELGSTNCRFCQAAQREEFLFLSRLVKRFQQTIQSDGERDWSSLHTTLCIPHLKQYLQRCAQEGVVSSSPWYLTLRKRNRNASSKASRQKEMQLLAADLAHFILRNTDKQNQSLQPTEPVWSQVAQRLAPLVGDQGALPALIDTNSQRRVPPQLLLVTSRRSQLQSPSHGACPVCRAEASACIEKYVHLIDSGASASMIGPFCQSHHWILAASIVLHQQTKVVEQYLSWLERELQHQLVALTGAHEERAMQGERPCMACALVVEVESEVISSMVQGLRQGHEDSATTKEGLLCLYHWRQAHTSCSSKPDSMVLQQRLLDHQLQHINALDTRLEAYLAHFNASKRARGEVPDIPEAAWAWERLLAFFAGEPALVYR